MVFIFNPDGCPRWQGDGKETATMCTLPFLSHFSQLLLLLSVCVTLCCCLFLFCFLDACLCFCFVMKPQDAVAGSIKSSMACMQTPCALRFSICMMCGGSTPYCMCSHLLLTFHDCSLFLLCSFNLSLEGVQTPGALRLPICVLFLALNSIQYM